MEYLIFSPTALGGIAEHSHYQARALMGARSLVPVEVVMLCSGEFLNGLKVEYENLKVLMIGICFLAA